MAFFDKWHAALALAGKGPKTIPCDRGVPFAYPLAIQEDLTGSTFRGEVRASPDATGSPLATFAISGLSVVGGVTSFTLSLTESQVNALPPAPAGEGVAELVFDLLETPPGGVEQRLMGGTFLVIGQVTA